MANRQAVQAMAAHTRRSSYDDFGSFLSAADFSSPASPFKGECEVPADEAGGDLLPPLGTQQSSPDLPGPPAMVARPSKMRHSFVPNYSTTSVRLNHTRATNHWHAVWLFVSHSYLFSRLLMSTDRQICAQAHRWTFTVVTTALGLIACLHPLFGHGQFHLSDRPMRRC